MTKFHKGGVVKGPVKHGMLASEGPAVLAPPKNGGYLPGTGDFLNCKPGDIDFFPLTAAEELQAALGIMLDAVDYQRGACTPVESVGAVLPVAVLEIARKAMERKV